VADVAVVKMRKLLPGKYLLTPHTVNGNVVMEMPKVTRDAVLPAT
jgi:hypothetical protein